MSFLDLYQGDQQQTAKIQPNEGTRLPSGFDENLHAAWSDGRLFSQSIAQLNARGAALDDYAAEVKGKTGFDLTNDLAPQEGGAPLDYDAVNFKIAALNKTNPALNIPPLSDDEIDKRALAKAQAAHRTYETLQSGEKTWGGSLGTFVGSSGAAASDPVNILALAVAPETGGIGILSSALRWGALAGVSQAVIEASSDSFKEQVQPGYMESGAPLQEIGGAFVGGAILGGATKALGNAWSRVKTGQWPTSVRDAGNVIESEANVASSNPFPGAAGEVAHREALVKSIDDILAGRPVDVQITPELQQAADEQQKIIRFYHGTAYEDASGFTGQTFVTPHYEYARDYHGGPNNVLYADMTHAEADARGLIDEVNRYPINGPIDDGAAILKPLPPPKQLDLPLEAEPIAPKVKSEKGPPPALQTPEQMRDTLTSPEHQDVIRGDIDRAIDANAAEGKSDILVPGLDENGNHTMVSVTKSVDEVDAYKKAATDIQACATMTEAAE